MVLAGVLALGMSPARFTHHDHGSPTYPNPCLVNPNRPNPFPSVTRFHEENS